MPNYIIFVEGAILRDHLNVRIVRPESRFLRVN